MVRRSRGLENEVQELRKQGIAVVLATTQEVQLGETVPLREDLDLYSREEAEEYVTREAGRDGAAIDRSLARARSGLDDFLIAPFYLDLIVRLQKAGVATGDLPEHRDRWRGEVLNRYVMAVCSTLWLCRGRGRTAPTVTTQRRGHGRPCTPRFGLRGWPR